MVGIKTGQGPHCTGEESQAQKMKPVVLSRTPGRERASSVSKDPALSAPKWPSQNQTPSPVLLPHSRRKFSEFLMKVIAKSPFHNRGPDSESSMFAVPNPQPPEPLTPTLHLAAFPALSPTLPFSIVPRALVWVFLGQHN